MYRYKTPYVIINQNGSYLNDTKGTIVNAFLRGKTSVKAYDKEYLLKGVEEEFDRTVINVFEIDV